MTQAHPLQRWKQIVFSIFWPVFLWNLRHFVARLERLMASHGREGRIVWCITWYGTIHIEVVYPEDRPTDLPDWAKTLAAHSRAVRAACLGLSDHFLLSLTPAAGALSQHESSSPKSRSRAGLAPPPRIMAGRGPPYRPQHQLNP